MPDFYVKDLDKTDKENEEAEKQFWAIRTKIALVIYSILAVVLIFIAARPHP